MRICHTDGDFAGLQEVLDRSRPKAVAEVALLSAAKLAAEGDGTIEPWDRTFYMGTTKADRFEIDSATLSAHFSVENCLAGLVRTHKHALCLRCTNTNTHTHR